MSTEKATIESATEEAIAKHKAKIEALKQANPKGVWQISAVNGCKVGYLRTPTRQEISYASTFLPKDQLGYADAILQNCWLEGDEALKENDKYFLSLVPQIDEIIEVEEVALKKL